MIRKTRKFASTASFWLACVGAFAQPAWPNGFESPSGNIVCYLDVFSDTPYDQKALHCLIFLADWDMPPDYGDNDPTCDLDRTRIVILPPEAPASARWVCHGDVFWPYPQGALSYGSEWSLPTFTCSVAQDGVRCRNEAGQGFHLRRSALVLE
ncbi:hypothetical protein C8N43_3153 [Litoreibacter ponti]|uniref:Uncharacterized protein n=1 Tax=Litoreibacter ponti TaxID=1510457 RepID=A0A2T6BE53_9RHOB|nr:DUF6636 domain-containing protein [Litoreibacter ponti]PTX54339.1 hypothetical protein C8N43_3153 [Litoreibacter ponti]